MIRNDNGDLAGYIYVYLDGVTAPEYVERAQEYLRSRLTLPPGYVDRVDRAVSVRRGGALDAAHRRADHAGHHVRRCWSWRSGPSLTASLIMLSAPFALVGGVCSSGTRATR